METLNIVWTCGVVPGHEHATEAEAQACIDRHGGVAVPPPQLVLSKEEWEALREKARKTMGGSEYPVQNVCRWLLRNARREGGK